MKEHEKKWSDFSISEFLGRVIMLSDYLRAATGNIQSIGGKGTEFRMTFPLE